MLEAFIIGLDFGTESARGVLISLASGKQVDFAVAPYVHATLTDQLPDGTPIKGRMFLQVPNDYLLAAEQLLNRLGRDRQVVSIGLDFTASSPLPADISGAAIADQLPAEPHAYVKLWKHSAQSHATGLLDSNPVVAARFGGRLSGEWFLAKALELSIDAPEIFARTDRFIEAGDWLVWQLTRNELRSRDFAAYKAQHDPVAGYPGELAEDFMAKFGPVADVGTSAGQMTADWLAKTGILGSPAVAVAVIDSHAVLPAVDDGAPGTLVGALGTSAAYLYLSDDFSVLPAGVEGVAFDAALPGLWCYEAGQAAFGDILAWFARSFPKGDDLEASFSAYNNEAAGIEPGTFPLLALDWWNGNRVPHSDSLLSGLLLGLTLQSSAACIYRSLMESLCYGTRSVIALFEDEGMKVERLVITSGLADRNPLLVQILADVTGRPLTIPQIDNATCVGAAIHGAVAGEVVKDFREGFARFGARQARTITPRPQYAGVYDAIYDQYCALSADTRIHEAMHVLRSVASAHKGQASSPHINREVLPSRASDRPSQRDKVF
ncbi:FGGY-family carbohydrate kinase [Rhizobium sp. BE258]|uniref:FGGY-family carbohydrate kinase n=1 Tax=Rhizobium sp. BE258 TaxID=2817722 RepID=UPI00285D442D|nr:FGGY-family carbohydrate kinase [Rhizobium sp. BE258]MDR7145192.1 L-ribulokinase [Rhizobium sp. BE258]